MAEFTWVESASTALSEEPRIASTRFGDGYEQRGPDGLNPNPQKWAMRFADVDDKAADAIITFLRARLTTTSGLEAFDYAPLWSGGVKLRFVCRKWQRTASATWGESHIDAEFEQVFEPG